MFISPTLYFLSSSLHCFYWCNNTLLTFLSVWFISLSPQHSCSALLRLLPPLFPSSFIIQREVAWMSTALHPNSVLRYHMRHCRVTSAISSCLYHVMLQQHLPHRRRWYRLALLMKAVHLRTLSASGEVGGCSVWVVMNVYGQQAGGRGSVLSWIRMDANSAWGQVADCQADCQARRIGGVENRELSLDVCVNVTAGWGRPLTPKVVSSYAWQTPP